MRIVSSHAKRGYEKDTHLNNMTRVPMRLATLVLSNAIESRRMTLAVVRLNRTRVNMNFQNITTSGTSPIHAYMIPPNTSGGTTRSGRMSKRILDAKYVNDE